ncbi:hypothetical protein ACFFQW_16690 [Umezawaea endophytica]|uniref:Uncharacterized protein n=1 Tax=Umezawaea endophytica TaxID=1654476 RepID=A0A9X3A264_9PSEU|nr:hypothetical protein [Umezawaea endophytica]MCS7480389.1 hypothetical protein [Umezawaea endophytica]
MRTELRNMTVATTAAVGLISAIGANTLSAAIDPEWARKNIWPLGIGVFLFVVCTAVWLHRWRPGSRFLGARAVAAVDTGDGIMEVVVATRSGTVLAMGYADNGTWSKWTDLRVDRMSWDVTAVVPTNHVVEYYAVDTEGAVRMARRDHGQLSAWHVVPLVLPSERIIRIASASFAPKHRELFCITDTGRSLHAWKWDGQPWSSWHDAGAPGSIDVAGCSPKNDVLEHFAVDRDGTVWQRWYADQQWERWHNWGRPGSPAKAVTSFRKATDFQEMFVVGKSGDLGHQWHSGSEGWSGWRQMDTPPSGLDDVAAGTTSAHNLCCIGLDKNGELWLRSWSGEWSQWRAIPMPR